MTSKQIATERFAAYDAEMIEFTFKVWPHLTIEERNARQAEIDARHNYKHGWMLDVNGENFCRDMIGQRYDGSQGGWAYL